MAFIASVIKVREEAADDAELLEEAAAKLQEHNRTLKRYLAKMDAQTAKEAMAGFGTDDSKLCVALCSRTKKQLKMTAEEYREAHGEELMDAVSGETSGDYGKLAKAILSTPEEFFADTIDAACAGIGTSEDVLIELLVPRTADEITAGKEKWEGRTDKSLIDYIDGELGFSSRHLQYGLLKLVKGEREMGDDVDEEKAAEQAKALNVECEKGFFSNFDEDAVSDILCCNSPVQNMKVAEIYENEYSKSLVGALDGRGSDDLRMLWTGLLLPRGSFVAQYLKKAMDGWGTDESRLIRLLGGLDGELMADVVRAFEEKYGTQLKKAIADELSGNFKRAALLWIETFEDPASGVEARTETDVSEVSGIPDELSTMIDSLLLENASVVSYIAKLDAETLASACVGMGTDDLKLVSCISARSKSHFVKVSKFYQEFHGKDLATVVKEETSGVIMTGYYSTLAQFIVMSEEECDVRVLDWAMDGLGTDEMPIIEFLCARPPKRVRAAKAKWEGAHDSSLVDRLGGELSGSLKTLCLTMLQGKRMEDDADDEEMDEALADEQAQTLYDNGAGCWGTNETAIIEMLCSFSPAQNRAIAVAYENKFDTSLAKAIKSEFGGKVRDALLALLQESSEWFAMQLRKAMQGFGTSDAALCRIIGCSDKPAILKIAACFLEKYGKPLDKAIAGECSGNYKRLAMAWVSVPDQLDVCTEEITFPSGEEEDDGDWGETSDLDEPATNTNAEDEVNRSEENEAEESEAKDKFLETFAMVVEAIKNDDEDAHEQLQHKAGRCMLRWVGESGLDREQLYEVLDYIGGAPGDHDDDLTSTFDQINTDGNDGICWSNLYEEMKTRKANGDM
eukprot:TRINITY_DN4039_c0_g1_i1.p1 TRINITY_DN4039_c0_g1~~TRINITY_DN4039_c0_g1_i1.p1  ORF type:complete len:851 (+),score=199.97 TRINITY_DN4039_c0_g1_i1:48-2600(+)